VLYKAHAEERRMGSIKYERYCTSKSGTQKSAWNTNYEANKGKIQNKIVKNNKPTPTFTLLDEFIWERGCEKYNPSA
jgi:hypothetical protein